MWEIDYYEKPNGRCPVRDFLDNLSEEDELPFVLRKIDLLEEYGYRLKRPHADYLRDDIFELRTKTRGGNIRILYFFFLREKIVLTHGLKKKASKVADVEIDKAVDYRKDYYQRNQEVKR